MILPLVAADNPILREVMPEGPVPAQVIENLRDTMQHHRALGLAAPQVGIRCRCFVTNFGTAFINPRYVGKSRELETEEEYCLSLPGISVRVPRHRKIRIRGQVYHYFEDYEARVIQHEMDHLNGILITDHGRGRISLVQ